MDAARRAFAAGELHLGDRHQHLSAGLQVGGFQKRLLLLDAVGAQHRETVDQGLVGGALDIVPIDLELVGLGEFAQGGEQARPVDRAFPLALVEIGDEVGIVDARLPVELVGRRLLEDAKAGDAEQRDEATAVARLGELGEAAKTADGAEFGPVSGASSPPAGWIMPMSRSPPSASSTIAR